jgi:hypothetical protein
MTSCPPWLAWYTNNTRLYFCDLFLHIQLEQWCNEEALIFGFKDKISDLFFEKNYINMDLYIYIYIYLLLFVFLIFLKWVGWWLCTRGFIKIWLEVRGGIRKKMIPPIIWWLVGTYSLNMASLDYFLIMWWLGPIFSQKKNSL